MSPCGSRVKPNLHKVPDLLKKQPKQLRLNGSRIFRRLRNKSRSKCLDNEIDTTQDVLNDDIVKESMSDDKVNNVDHVNGSANNDFYVDMTPLIPDVIVMSLRLDGCDMNNMVFDVD